MIALTPDEIACAVGGRLVMNPDGDPSQRIRGAAQTDSREVQPGQIFVARRGETTDGHRFVPQAVERGAALLIVEHEGEERVPQVVVEDATVALGLLAQFVIARKLEDHAFRIVAITGSNGKTTTKNLVAAMAEQIGSTVASEKSFNNEVGGPLTMLRVESGTEILVAEMGASASGEITRLTTMAPPHIAVVLSVGLAHVGEFGGIEGTFAAKSEMVRDLPDDAVAVLNRDDPWVAKMADLTSARVVWFGLRDDAHVRASEVVASASGTTFTLWVGGQSKNVHFQVLGEHHVMNALAAAAVATELGMGIDDIVTTLEAATIAAPGRMQVLPCRDGITVINDAYNASPDSMRAALKTLALIADPSSRTVAVLGKMAELGEFSGEAHDQLGLLAVRLGISELIVVGAEARRLHISAINEGSWDGESVFVEDQDEAFAYLMSRVRPRDVILVKGSNSAGLQALGDRLGEALA